MPHDLAPAALALLDRYEAGDRTPELRAELQAASDAAGEASARLSTQSPEGAALEALGYTLAAAAADVAAHRASSTGEAKIAIRSRRTAEREALKSAGQAEKARERQREHEAERADPTAQLRVKLNQLWAVAEEAERGALSATNAAMQARGEFRRDMRETGHSEWNEAEVERLEHLAREAQAARDMAYQKHREAKEEATSTKQERFATKFSAGSRVSLNSLATHSDGVVTEIVSPDRVRVLWDSSRESGPRLVDTKNLRAESPETATERIQEEAAAEARRAELAADPALTDRALTPEQAELLRRYETTGNNSVIFRRTAEREWVPAVRHAVERAERSVGLAEASFRPAVEALATWRTWDAERRTGSHPKPPHMDRESIVSSIERAKERLRPAGGELDDARSAVWSLAEVLRKARDFDEAERTLRWNKTKVLLWRKKLLAEGPPEVWAKDEAAFQAAVASAEAVARKFEALAAEVGAAAVPGRSGDRAPIETKTEASRAQSYVVADEEGRREDRFSAPDLESAVQLALAWAKAKKTRWATLYAIETDPNGRELSRKPATAMPILNEEIQGASPSGGVIVHESAKAHEVASEYRRAKQLEREAEEAARFTASHPVQTEGIEELILPRVNYGGQSDPPHNARIIALFTDPNGVVFRVKTTRKGTEWWASASHDGYRSSGTLHTTSKTKGEAWRAAVTAGFVRVERPNEREEMTDRARHELERVTREEEMARRASREAPALVTRVEDLSKDQRAALERAEIAIADSAKLKKFTRREQKKARQREARAAVQTIHGVYPTGDPTGAKARFPRGPVFPHKCPGGACHDISHGRIHTVAQHVVHLRQLEGANVAAIVEAFEAAFRADAQVAAARAELQAMADAAPETRSPRQHLAALAETHPELVQVATAGAEEAAALLRDAEAKLEAWRAEQQRTEAEIEQFREQKAKQEARAAHSARWSVQKAITKALREAADQIREGYKELKDDVERFGEESPYAKKDREWIAKSEGDLRAALAIRGILRGSPAAVAHLAAWAEVRDHDPEDLEDVVAELERWKASLPKPDQRQVALFAQAEVAAAPREVRLPNAPSVASKMGLAAAAKSKQERDAIEAAEDARARAEEAERRAQEKAELAERRIAEAARGESEKKNAEARRAAKAADEAAMAAESARHAEEAAAAKAEGLAQHEAAAREARIPVPEKKARGTKSDAAILLHLAKVAKRPRRAALPGVILLSPEGAAAVLPGETSFVSVEIPGLASERIVVDAAWIADVVGRGGSKSIRFRREGAEVQALADDGSVIASDHPWPDDARFANMPQPAGAAIELSPRDFAPGGPVARALAHVSADETRPAVNSLCLTGGLAVGTDGHSLARVALEGRVGPELLLRRRDAEEILALVASLPPERLTLAREGLRILVAGDDGRSWQLRAYAPEAAFPPWQQVWPRESVHQMAFRVADLRALAKPFESAGLLFFPNGNVAAYERKSDDASEMVSLFPLGPGARLLSGFSADVIDLDSLKRDVVEVQLSDGNGDPGLFGPKVVAMPLRFLQPDFEKKFREASAAGTLRSLHDAPPKIAEEKREPRVRADDLARLVVEILTKAPEVGLEPHELDTLVRKARRGHMPPYEVQKEALDGLLAARVIQFVNPDGIARWRLPRIEAEKRRLDDFEVKASKGNRFSVLFKPTGANIGELPSVDDALMLVSAIERSDVRPLFDAMMAKSTVENAETFFIHVLAALPEDKNPARNEMIRSGIGTFGWKRLEAIAKKAHELRASTVSLSNEEREEHLRAAERERVRLGKQAKRASEEREARANEETRAENERNRPARELAETAALLSAAGYSPEHAPRLVAEGLTGLALEDRLKHAPGSVGSLGYTHGIQQTPEAQARREALEREAFAIEEKHREAAPAEQQEAEAATNEALAVAPKGDRAVQLVAAIQYLEKTGRGKGGRIRPAFQAQIDAANAELAGLVQGAPAAAPARAEPTKASIAIEDVTPENHPEFCDQLLRRARKSLEASGSVRVDELAASFRVVPAPSGEGFVPEITLDGQRMVGEEALPLGEAQDAILALISRTISGSMPALWKGGIRGLASGAIAPKASLVLAPFDEYAEQHYSQPTDRVVLAQHRDGTGITVTLEANRAKTQWWLRTLRGQTSAANQITTKDRQEAARWETAIRAGRVSIARGKSRAHTPEQRATEYLWDAGDAAVRAGLVNDNYGALCVGLEAVAVAAGAAWPPGLPHPNLTLASKGHPIAALISDARIGFHDVIERLTRDKSARPSLAETLAAMDREATYGIGQSIEDAKKAIVRPPSPFDLRVAMESYAHDWAAEVERQAKAAGAALPGPRRDAWYARYAPTLIQNGEREIEARLKSAQEKSDEWASKVKRPLEFLRLNAAQWSFARDLWRALHVAAEAPIDADASARIEDNKIVAAKQGDALEQELTRASEARARVADLNATTITLEVMRSHPALLPILETAAGKKAPPPEIEERGKLVWLRPDPTLAKDQARTVGGSEYGGLAGRVRVVKTIWRQDDLFIHDADSTDRTKQYTLTHEGTGMALGKPFPRKDMAVARGELFNSPEVRPVFDAYLVSGAREKEANALGAVLKLVDDPTAAKAEGLRQIATLKIQAKAPTAKDLKREPKEVEDVEARRSALVLLLARVLGEAHEPLDLDEVYAAVRRAGAKSTRPEVRSALEGMVPEYATKTADERYHTAGAEPGGAEPPPKPRGTPLKEQRAPSPPGFDASGNPIPLKNFLHSSDPMTSGRTKCGRSSTALRVARSMEDFARAADRCPLCDASESQAPTSAGLTPSERSAFLARLGSPATGLPFRAWVRTILARGQAHGSEVAEAIEGIADNNAVAESLIKSALGLGWIQRLGGVSGEPTRNQQFMDAGHWYTGKNRSRDNTFYATIFHYGPGHNSWDAEAFLRTPEPQRPAPRPGEAARPAPIPQGPGSLPKSARRSQLLEVHAYDGSYKAKDLIANIDPGRQMHQFPATKAGKEAARDWIRGWVQARPPQGRDAKVWVEEKTARGPSSHDCPRVEAEGGAWKVTQPCSWLTP